MNAYGIQPAGGDEQTGHQQDQLARGEGQRDARLLGEEQRREQRQSDRSVQPRQEVHRPIIHPGSARCAQRDRPAAEPFCESARVMETDAVVVGAGPSGATTALLLARLGHDVVLVDRARLPARQGVRRGGDAARRRRRCAGLGLYERVLATGARPLRGVTYQQRGWQPRVARAVPDAAGWRTGRTGWGCAAPASTRCSSTRCAEEPRASVREGERVTGLLRDAVRRASPGSPPPPARSRPAIVIAADGLHSQIRCVGGAAACHLGRACAMGSPATGGSTRAIGMQSR